MPGAGLPDLPADLPRALDRRARRGVSLGLPGRSGGACEGPGAAQHAEKHRGNVAKGLPGVQGAQQALKTRLPTSLLQ